MCGTYDNTGVTSLMFITTESTYGPYGEEVGTEFAIDQGFVVAFFGRSRDYLNAIGAYIKA